MCNRAVKEIRRLGKREDGSAMIEFAIVFPILLLLFAASAEIGRLLNTYTTLAKATDIGARYLSASRDATSSDSTLVAAATLKAQRLVVCGYSDTCSGRTPVVAGLDVNNPATNVKVTLPLATDTVKYVKVEIQSYSFPPGVFNLAGMTGQPSSKFYFALTPATKMRYMR
jgi:Flp pilus assembly protein TadG